MVLTKFENKIMLTLCQNLTQTSPKPHPNRTPTTPKPNQQRTKCFKTVLKHENMNLVNKTLNKYIVSDIFFFFSF